MSRLRSPITWFGGKGRMTANLLPLLPDSERYVEVFGGGASVLLAKKPCPVETYNDLNQDLFRFFSVLANPDKFSHFVRLVEALPVSRDFYNEYLETWEETQNEIERSAKWFYVARMSFSGAFGQSISLSVGASGRGMADPSSRWLTILETLPQIHARLQRVQIENRDWRFILDTHDHPDCVFYLDPPYVLSARKGGGYKHEMTDTDHAELIERLLSLKASWVLSGYNSEIYEPLSCIKRYDFETSCHAAGRTKASKNQGKGSALRNHARTESVWVCDKQARQIGISFRESEACK